MKQLFFALAFTFVSVPCLASSEYRDGWDVEKFYEAVNFCRKSIVFPQSQNFTNQALKNGETQDDATSKSIKMTPVFDRMVTDVCFCTANEVAKDNAPTAFPESVDIQAYMQIPRCKSAMEASVKDVMGDKRRINEAMLP